MTIRHIRRSGKRSLPAVALLSVALMAGCDNLLEVTNPGSVEAGDLNNPTLATTLVNSALGQFECAYTSYVASTGILGQELIDSSNWANLNGWGQRGLQLEQIAGSCVTTRAASSLGAFTPLQQARFIAEDSKALIESFESGSVPGAPTMLATLEVHAAYATLLLGEGFCEMSIDTSPLMTRAETFARAEGSFGTAISLADAAGEPDLRNFAIAGRARARLNLGDLEGAAQDAASIPEGFVRYAEYSTNDASRENRLYNMNRLNRFLSANAAEYAGLESDGVPDPRVLISNSGLVGHDNLTEHWYQQKYDGADAFIPIASWAEAQLILAEARPAEAEEAINRLRASQGLPPVTIAPGEDPIEVVLEERRRQLFLEGHRLNDMIRHDLPFPTGFNHKGQAWGPVTCMPLPDQERRNNPNIPS